MATNDPFFKLRRRFEVRVKASDCDDNGMPDEVKIRKRLRREHIDPIRDEYMREFYPEQFLEKEKEMDHASSEKELVIMS